MDCSEAKQLVRILLIDQGTNPPRELDEHLRECRVCADRFAPLLVVSSNLQHLPARDLPAGFDARFTRRMKEEARKGWKSALLSLVACDEFRGALVLVLSVGPIAAVLDDAVPTPSYQLLISASNIGVVALGLLFAAAFVHAVLHWDVVMEIIRRKTV